MHIKTTPDSPCYGCGDRTQTGDCHDNCDAYKLYRALIQEEKQKRRGIKMAGAVLHEGARKMLKKRNGRTDG